VLIQDYVEGEDQSEILARHECLREILELNNDLLKKIHQIETADVEAFWYPDDAWHKVHVPWHIYMTDEIDETLKSIAKCIPNIIIRNKVRMVLRRLREYINKKNYKLTVLHGDFAPQNIVVTKNDGLRCLDFERARIGDRIWDYAYYFGWLQRQDKKAEQIWKDIIQSEFTPQQQEYFEFYSILFHTWTIRDGHDYKKSTLRASRGQLSYEILSNWAGVK
jgi:aminoglycoside phosphotransferase (APT) family kinase protein